MQNCTVVIKSLPGVIKFPSVHFTDFDAPLKPDTMVLNTIVDCLDESHVDPVLGIL